MITRAHVMPYMGQRVIVTTRDGVMHHGILHSASNDGIYVRPLQGRGNLVSAGEATKGELLSDIQSHDVDLEQVWLPFLFFPWWWIGAFRPWGWLW